MNPSFRIRAPRKSRVRPIGGKRSPFLRLKHLQPEVRAKLYGLSDQLTCAQWREKVKELTGIRLSSDSHVTRFRDWQFEQQMLEKRNSRVEQFEEFFREKNPMATAEEIRSAAMAFMLTEAAMDGDRKGFVLLARTSIADDAERRQRDEFEFDAAEACLRHLPALREIAANNDLDEQAKLVEVRKRLFGSAPS